MSFYHLKLLFTQLSWLIQHPHRHRQFTHIVSQPHRKQPTPFFNIPPPLCPQNRRLPPHPPKLGHAVGRLCHHIAPINIHNPTLALLDTPDTPHSSPATCFKYCHRSSFIGPTLVKILPVSIAFSISRVHELISKAIPILPQISTPAAT